MRIQTSCTQIGANSERTLARCEALYFGFSNSRYKPLSHELVCYRCGESLAALSLPFSRRDQCSSCSADLHVCKMCRFFDASVSRQCREDGADDVTEKERPNFCDWYVPTEKAFDPDRKSVTDNAREALDALFGDSDGT